MWKTRLFAATILAGCMASSHAFADEPRMVRMSQVGFETQGPKTASVPDPSRRPLPWRVVDSSGHTVGAGETTVFGDDAASGEHLHTATFSQVERIGAAYRLIVGNHESRPFRIADHPHDRLKYDALAYFYQNRAGGPITADHVSRPELARPAGHVQEVATCFSGQDLGGVNWPGCDYSLDVTGGWYDAGDHGKYVVNGGIAVWMLLNAYERAQAKDGAEPFADGEVDIPEAGNGVNDLLDEARYEIEFLLRMQIPDGKTAVVPADRPVDGQPTALVEIDAGGMVHHKVHDVRWTPIPTAPAEDHETRFLYPPSTGATLNLAAVGAQCARIWKSIDVEFARRCANASQRAFRAAIRNKTVFASETFDGGGPYGDDDFADEFYWATAEHYISTGSDAYLSALKTSPYYLGGPRSGATATGDPGFSVSISHEVPCKNGSTCNDLVNSYSCTCPSGFSDYNCTTNDDECILGCEAGAGAAGTPVWSSCCLADQEDSFVAERSGCDVGSCQESVCQVDPGCCGELGGHWSDDCVALAETPDVIFTTFGDAMRVPGSKKSLLQARAEGCDVRMVYSPLDSLELAKQNPDKQVVFFALGFETTMPSTALTILLAERDGVENFTVFCNHITIISTIKAIQDSPELSLDGFLGPGHVSRVIGDSSYDFIASHYNRPLVITGFEPLDVLHGIWMVLKQIGKAGPKSRINTTVSFPPEETPPPWKRLARCTKSESSLSGAGWVPSTTPGFEFVSPMQSSMPNIGFLYQH